MTITEVLKSHFLKYRKMTPQDTVKLIFQSEFGGGHLITDEKYVLERLKKETLETVRDESIPMTEYLGDDAYRINLASLPTSLSPETLAKIFAESAVRFHGKEERFSSKLNEVIPLISEKYTSFSEYDYIKYLEEYYKNGGGAVRHSFIYSLEYKPAYRVIHADFVPFIELFARIDEALSANSVRVIKLDGRCGSGKTTLGGLISSVYGCGVIHADDFYVPRNRRDATDDNLDFERMSCEINSILSGDTDRYGRFDCSEQRITENIPVKTEPFILVEGSYSLHEKLSVPSFLKIFLTISPEEQIARIEKRDPDSVTAFREKWIPLEEEYFTKFDVSKTADIVIDTSKII